MPRVALEHVDDGLSWNIATSIASISDIECTQSVSRMLVRGLPLCICSEKITCHMMGCHYIVNILKVKLV